jgi:hypothetical protein
MRVLLSRLGDNVLPRGYDPDLPYLRIEYDSLFSADAVARGESWPSFKAPAVDRRLMENWLKVRAKGRRVVTVTLRRNFEDLSRNSRLDVWQQFARSLDPDRYCVIFVDDTYGVFDRAPEGSDEGIFYCDLASFSVTLRLALYEHAYVNLLTINGPLTICVHDADVRYIITNFGAGDGINAVRTHMTLNGLAPPQHYPFAGPFQRLVWAPETLPTIQAAFASMVADMEQAGVT